MTVEIVQFASSGTRRRDWTNDEISELYRVEHALVQSGVSVHIARGVTDEGDPWFVFCRPNGDVIVHITRYDRLYRLHSLHLLIR